MKDAEIRGLLLQMFYNHREVAMFQPLPEHFGGTLTEAQIVRISVQLKDQGLVDGPMQWGGLDGGGYAFGNITAFGADVVEGATPSPIALTFVNNSVNISNSSGIHGVIAGNNNQQTVSQCVAELARIVDSSSASPAEKAEAKSRLRSFLEHPLVAAVAGAAATAALGI